MRNKSQVSLVIVNQSFRARILILLTGEFGEGEGRKGLSCEFLMGWGVGEKWGLKRGACPGLTLRVAIRLGLSLTSGKGVHIFLTED